MRGHCAPPFTSRCTILDFFRFRNKALLYKILFIYHSKYYLYHFLIYFALFIITLPSAFHKRFFLKKLSLLKLLFSLLYDPGCSFFFIFSHIVEFKVHGWLHAKKLLGPVGQMKNVDRYIMACVI